MILQPFLSRRSTQNCFRIGHDLAMLSMPQRNENHPYVRYRFQLIQREIDVCPLLFPVLLSFLRPKRKQYINEASLQQFIQCRSHSCVAGQAYLRVYRTTSIAPNMRRWSTRRKWRPPPYPAGWSWRIPLWWWRLRWRPWFQRRPHYWWLNGL